MTYDEVMTFKNFLDNNPSINILCPKRFLELLIQDWLEKDATIYGYENGTPQEVIMDNRDPMESFKFLAGYDPIIKMFLKDYIENYIELFQSYLKPYGLTLRVVSIKDVEGDLNE